MDARSECKWRLTLRCSRLRPATDCYCVTFPAWAEAAELGTLAASAHATKDPNHVHRSKDWRVCRERSDWPRIVLQERQITPLRRRDIPVAIRRRSESK